MRELLFRGIREDNNAWLFSDSILRIDANRVALWAKQGGWREVKPDTVGEYVGKTDKKGSKIFDGDIIKHGDEIGVINFIEGCFCVRKQSTSSRQNNPAIDVVFAENPDDIEVIGTIHADLPKAVEITDNTCNWYMMRFQKHE